MEEFLKNLYDRVAVLGLDSISKGIKNKRERKENIFFNETK
jgi:hypothetical protein